MVYYLHYVSRDLKLEGEDVFYAFVVVDDDICWLRIFMPSTAACLMLSVFVACVGLYLKFF